jgi:ABC-type antimicrobial peptide transport system permease subunit
MLRFVFRQFIYRPYRTLLTCIAIASALAIVRALGFRNWHIYSAALLQSLLVTTLGLLMAVLISYILMVILPPVIPQISLAVRFHKFIPLFIISIPVTMFASLSAASSIVRVDPMMVFNAQAV